MVKNLFSADGSNHLVELKQPIKKRKKVKTTKKIKQPKPILPMKEKLKPGPKPILTEEQKAENRRIANANYREKNQEKMKALKSEWYKNNSEYAKKKAKEKYQAKKNPN